MEGISKEQVYEWLATVTDPEVPALTILDLGIVRDVIITGAGSDTRVQVIITPTYSGCPAMDVISIGIRMALLSRNIKKVDVQLQLSVEPPALTDDQFDVCIRFGAPPDARVIARHIAPNRRLLCASPGYLASRGTPRTPEDLAGHDGVLLVGEHAGA